MKRQDTKTMVIMFAIMSIAVVWFALKISLCYEDGIKLFDLLERIPAALNQTFNIAVNQYSIKFVLLFLFAYEMGIGLYFSSRENR